MSKKFKKLENHEEVKSAMEKDKIRGDLIFRRATDVDRREIPDFNHSRGAFVLLGGTGAGKTTFFNSLCKKNHRVGHGRESCTTKIAMAYSEIANAYMIDTRGFRDNRRKESEDDLMREFFTFIHDNKVKVHGFILFVHASELMIRTRKSEMSIIIALRLVEELYGKDMLTRFALLICDDMVPNPYVPHGYDFPICMKNFQEMYRDYGGESVFFCIPSKVVKESCVNEREMVYEDRRYQKVNYHFAKNYFRKLTSIDPVQPTYKYRECKNCGKVADPRLTTGGCYVHSKTKERTHAGEKIYRHVSERRESYHDGKKYEDQTRKIWTGFLNFGMSWWYFDYTRYKCCEKWKGERGCKRRLACPCKGKVKSKGCRELCSNCEMLWNETKGCQLICADCGEEVKRRGCIELAGHNWSRVVMVEKVSTGRVKVSKNRGWKKRGFGYIK